MALLDLPADWETVWECAKAARQNAYSPYSHFKVGAALRLKQTSKPVPGCNVENASYGGTICAERTAVTAAVALHGIQRGDLEYLVLVTDTESPTVPCALCLQVLAEFCPADFPIYLADTRAIREMTTLGHLLPRPFIDFSADEDEAP